MDQQNVKPYEKYRQKQEARIGPRQRSREVRVECQSKSTLALYSDPPYRCNVFGGGEVFVYLKPALGGDEDLMARIKRLAASVAGLEIQVNLRMLPK